MNYIYLIRDWMQVMREDDRTKTQHFALYMTLFQEWNYKFFRNPITLNRENIMAQARIGTVNFYIKTMKELAEWAYIRYEPSYDPRQGSRVYLHVFRDGDDNGASIGSDNGGDIPGDTGGDNGDHNGTDIGDRNGGRTASDRGDHNGSSIGDRNGGDNGRETLYKTNTNTTNKLNSINSYGTSNENSNFVNDRGADPYAQATGTGNHFRKKETSGGRGAGRGHDIPASVQEAQEYFLAQQSTTDEAEKFCNHYQANGWLMGGRTPIQDWRAQARNWIKNAIKFTHENRSTQQPKPGPLNNGPKNYGEPF
ncbi:hypothetical protein [Dawidia soli]|uniref:Uncharacterized protein n=1 Tax=Dawidia soli TaxID=2782352 RepID=A0AAP2D7T3_9BACT|nr:hypothetical protein [Dawidia soli]MBT1686186.1 hypothetical protein [Dawidia soli]